MAVWEPASALTSFRTRLGDNPADKYEFKVDAVPTPDGVSTRFFGGKTRVVPGTLEIYQGSTLIVPTEVSDVTGSFTVAPAPSGVQLQASFYWQWFTDAELIDFLGQASEALRFTGYTDAALPQGLRPVVLAFAVYYAYMRKAGEWAEMVTASAGGYTADQGAGGPNWRQLAADALRAAKDELDRYVDNPLASVSPEMRIVSYGLRNLQPRT